MNMQQLNGAIKFNSDPRPCILCGTPTMNRGYFQPHDPEPWGNNTLIYPICEACTEIDRTEMMAKVEERLAILVKEKREQKKTFVHIFSEN